MAECCAVDPQASWVFKINKTRDPDADWQGYCSGLETFRFRCNPEKPRFAHRPPVQNRASRLCRSSRIALGMCSGENEGVRLEMQSVRARWFARVPVQVCDVG